MDKTQAKLQNSDCCTTLREKKGKKYVAKVSERRGGGVAGSIAECVENANCPSRNSG